MSCIFPTPLILQGLTRAVTCLLLLLSIKMYPQLGEDREWYIIKVVPTALDNKTPDYLCYIVLLIVTWKQWS